jgi:hypothetical protein
MSFDLMIFEPEAVLCAGPLPGWLLSGVLRLKLRLGSGNRG